MNATSMVLLIIGAISVLIVFFTLILFIGGGRKEQATYAHPKFGFLTRCFLRLSGHHPSEFDRLDPADTWRFAACGVSTLFPAFVAACGILLTCHVFGVGGLGLACAGFFAVLLLDFILVTALGDNGVVKTQWPLIIYRALLAISLGWFIARPLILLLYGGAIDAANRSNRWEEIRRTTQQRETLRREALATQTPLAEHWAARRNQLEEQIRALTPIKQKMQLEIIENQKRREEEELKGREGRDPGPGDFWKAEGRYLNEKNEKLAKLESEEVELLKELSTLAEAQETQMRKGDEDPTLRALGEAAGKQITELNKNAAGWAEREDLMIRCVLEQPLKRLPGFVAVHSFLLMVDLLPLLTLLFVRRDNLDKARRIREERLDAELEAAKDAYKDGAKDHMREIIACDLLQQRGETLKRRGDLAL